MPGFGLREFECTLCQQSFIMPSGDLILPEPNICDECLNQVWEMKAQALTAHVIGCLPSEENALVNNVVQHIKRYKEQGGEIEEVLQHREQGRKMFG